MMLLSSAFDAPGMNELRLHDLHCTQLNIKFW